MIDGLELRTGYFGDRASFLALRDLLQDTFDIDIGEVDRFGGQDPTAMPFGYFDAGGRCVANFSAFSMPLIVDGKLVCAAGYQSGAVRPEYRGRGLYRDLMQRAFEWSVAEGFDIGILMTDKPELYEPYGFRVVQQHFFQGEMPEMRVDSRSRPLSMASTEDATLVQSILGRRTPVSDRFAVTEQRLMFLLNCCFDPDMRISHLPEEDAIVAWKQDGGTLKLLDVAAPRTPSLSYIVTALGVEAGTIEVYFPPDNLDWSGTPAIYRGYCELMVAGDSPRFSPVSQAMLSPLADF